MEKEVLVLNCQKCGEEFLYEYRGSGRKPDYCEDCRKKMKNEQTKLWKATFKANRAMGKVATKKVFTNTDIKPITETDDFSGYAQKLANLLMSLDSIRVELCDLSKQMGEYQSGFDKNDQANLHRLEILDTSDVAKTNEFVAEWQKARNSRRGIKDLITLAGSVIDKIPYKNFSNALPVLRANTNKYISKEIK